MPAHRFAPLARPASRRAVLAAAAGAAMAGRNARGVRAQTPVPNPATEVDWAAFDGDVADAMTTFQMVGAAVAVVTADGVLHRNAYGLKDLASGAPVTAGTHFLVASTTKSMTSLLVATSVDEGLLGWDQPVRDAWPDFRAPTAELSETMRVRDLMGMASGIGEPPATSAFHEGDPTAPELLASLATLPVIADPGASFFYNNTVYAAAGYLPALVEGTAPDDLETAYSRQMEERVYGPAGMANARIADDPRLFVDDYATGHAPDFVLGTAAEPFAPVGSYAPVGGTLATLDDMAAYVAMQLRGGLAADGTRVVSADNLAACWAPHVDVPTSPAFDPDAASAGYGMGWISATYKDGRRLVWHNGGIDGFSTHIAFLPEEDLGLVILTNVGPMPRGLYFAPYVVNLLLGARFGLNRGANDAVAAAFAEAAAAESALAAQALPVDPAAVAPFLGHYEKGWSLGFDGDGVLRLRQSSRSLRVMAVPDGSYVLAGGLLPGQPLDLSRDETGMPRLAIRDVETVRWTGGPASWEFPIGAAATPTA